MTVKRKQTAQQKLNNFLRSDEAKTYPLDGYMKATLSALASYFYYAETCWPSIPQICEYSSFSSAQTKRALSLLEGLSLLTITRKRGSGNVYTWKIPDISDKEIYSKKPVGKYKQTRKVSSGRA